MAKKSTRRKKPAKQKKADRGRPFIISPEMIKNLVAALQSGAYIETAAAYAGISKDTFYRWLKIGRAVKDAAMDEETGLLDMNRIPADQRQFAELSDAVEKAQADSEMICLQQIQKAALDGAWQAAAWRLERKFPQRYGRRTVVAATATIGEGQLDDGKSHGQAAPGGQESADPASRPALDPRNPPVLHLTLAIGDREIDPDPDGHDDEVP